ncbi:NAD(P)-dependent oxidoreductase, partial [Streptomyces flaveolus]|uniref:NAD(P)-dependent oxidoreductase n=1 Tax=Streptomyces flaveolus TaxID=67297 RepID=UPI00342F0B47
MRKLEVVQLLGSAHDHMAPLLDLVPPGTTLATARGVRGEAAAELAVTLLLSPARGLDRFACRQTRSRWRPECGATLVGKRVLVVGYGAVGAAVAARLRAIAAAAGRDPPGGRRPWRSRG